VPTSKAVAHPRRHAVEPDDVDQFPLDAPQRRVRLRRGGPRTPLPLLPVIAIAAGIGIAYINQTAHTTQATYHATELTAQQQQLGSQAAQLGDELARLQSSERLVAAAQQLGMRPADKWAYTASNVVPIVPASAAPQLTGGIDQSALQQLVAALVGAYGPSGRGR
jgi:hypothetical protein